MWPHQERALATLDPGDSVTYVVVPPGGGKTLIGLEAARRLGRRTLVLCPNTAIQAQWLGQWSAAFAPQAVAATVSRDLPTPLTVLTYQAVCTDSSVHQDGRRVLSELNASGPATLILDECHHLLEVWGRVLREVVAQLDRPHLIGLTATPPHMMTAEQAKLHEALFGAIDLEISVPSLVRDGRLAPYQELVYFTAPTPPESDYIHGEALRFAELRTGLLDPGFATTSFLGWLQGRVVERRSGGAQVSWQRFEKDESALADAALRLHTAGLLALPEGARLREQHRHPPDASDWVTLIGDYVGHCLAPSTDPRDMAAREAIRRALPSVGYRLTKTGIRAAESPIDRVLARSESKAHAVTGILGTEDAELGSRLRALVLCDFESAGGMVPADLAGVMDPEAGGASLALATLLESLPGLDPVLMTGQRVACGEATAQRLLGWLRETEPGLRPRMSPAGKTVEITAETGWEPRRYVPLVTRFFTEGGSRCLIGTRALLGEGWDAPSVNVVVDLTTATTPTSVVQARGRALRLDPAWPGKVANNWAVVCVTDQHPKGAVDYSRFVRKHDRYFALSGTGDIISGVAHVDPVLSPFEPPAEGKFDELNAAMLVRAQAREAVRERWAVGEPYADEPVATVTVVPGRSLGLQRRSAANAAGPAGPSAGRVSARRSPQPVVLILLAVATAVALAAAPLLAAVAIAALAVVAATLLARTTMRSLAGASSGSLDDIAAATADGLHAAGMVGRGSDAVRVEVLPDGSYRARLTDVPATESTTFANALDEVLSPLGQPRYIVPRLVVTRPPDMASGFRLAVRRLVTGHIPAAVIYHAVPSVLGGNKKTATLFAQAWNTRVSPGELLYAGSPEGAGILTVQRGDDPFAVTTQIRTLWR
ncbi:MAG TPA: DEAD/DEAH box helicase family protein [Trebonia sp.]